MADEAEIYNKMGNFYDLVYPEDFDSEFYLKEARKCGGKVLELGCGTGRITIKLMKAGIDITGLDISERMLKLLEKNAGKEGLKPKTCLGDMRDFKIDEQFRLAIFPYRSFLHMLTRDDREKVLKNVYSHLEDGGKIVLHIYRPSEEELGCTGRLRKIDKSEVIKDNKRYVLDWSMQYYPENRNADYVITVNDENGNEVNRFEMTISFVTLEELKTLLGKAGFSNIKAYCGFDYEEFNEYCQEVVVVAEKWA